MNNILKKIAFIQNRNVTVYTSVQKCVVKSLILNKFKKIFCKDITFIKNVCVCIYVLFSFLGKYSMNTMEDLFYETLSQQFITKHQYVQSFHFINFKFFLSTLISLLPQ